MTGGSGDRNKAEIELDISGDAVEQAKELAKQLDAAADAEERLQKEMAKRQRVLSGLATQKVREQAREQREADRTQRQGEREQQTKQRLAERAQRQQEAHTRRVRQQEERDAADAERRMQRVTSGLARQRVQEESRARREADRAAREAERRQARQPGTVEAEARRRLAHMKREEAVKSRLDALTGRTQKSGLAGVAQAVEGRLGLQAGALDGVAGRVSGMAGPAAWMAAFAAAGKFGVDTMTTVNDQLQYGSPYADDFTRSRQIFGNLPMAREFFAATDMLSGRSQAVGRENRRRIEEEARAPVRFEAMQVQADLARSERAARLNASSVRQHALPSAVTGDRRTVSQQREFNLAQRLLPLEEQRVEAATARAEAENAVTAAQERQKKLAEERRLVQERIDRTYAGGKRLYQAGGMQVGDAEYMRRQNVIAADTKRAEELDRLEVAGRTEIQGLEGQSAQARQREREATAARDRGRLADLQQREQAAGSQAERLAMMGPEGRLRGQFALLAARTYGMSMLSQDQISAGAAYAPETFRAMATEEGQRYVGEARRSGAGEEYRDDVPAIRREVDEAARRLQGQRQADREAGRDDLVKVAELGGDAAGERIADALERALKRIEDKVVERVQNDGTRQGYNPPRG